MSYFTTPYTIHFDDTMAYGSHHFVTGFKFQCAAREALLYGDLIFDKPGVPTALEAVHLFTGDAYCRNLSPAFLGDRLAIFLTLEEWGLVSARFCYRVLGVDGRAICAGFQTIVCADAKTGVPRTLPAPLQQAFDSIREIEEPNATMSFRDRVLAGGDGTQSLFTDSIRECAREYLADRYGIPKIVRARESHSENVVSSSQLLSQARSELSRDQSTNSEPEVWVFPGQGAFDAQLLSDRVVRWTAQQPSIRRELEACVQSIQQRLGGDPGSLLSGDSERCLKAVRETPGLSQVGIYIQGVSGAELRRVTHCPAVMMGHSLGEIAALTAAGSLTLGDGVIAVCERVRAVAAYGPSDGGLLVAMTDRPTAAEEIALSKLRTLVVAGRNHDRQTVVSGRREQLEHFASRLRQIGIESTPIPSPTSFHHPILRQAATAWLKELTRLQFAPPKVAVYSPIGRRGVAPGDDIATLLSTQFLRPFDLQGAIDDLVMVGMTNFVDCGSSGVLERLLTTAGPESIQVSRVESPFVQRVASPILAPGSGSNSSTASVPGAPRHTNGVGFLAPVAPSTTLPKVAALPTSPNAKIAIVGHGCLLPGHATSPAELHATILQGRSGIVDLRLLDADWEADFFRETLEPDRSTSALAGMVDDRDIVCPRNVAPSVFEKFSRAQKLLAIALSQCVQWVDSDARVLCLIGATADGFQDQDVVAALRFAGVDAMDADVAARIAQPPAAYMDSHTAIRQVFDALVRPGLDIRLIDAACASSLYSVGLGMAALENHETDIVVAGGLYCPGAGNNCLFSQFGGLTANSCRPFDANADGVVFSEGAAVLVMRRRDDALKLGQQPQAIIRGVGLSSDGKSPSANVPQTAGQLIAVQRCYENYAIAPASIGAIEGHGTSTPAGDSTEINTLRSFFAEHVSSPIPLHSLKGAIGHTGWAAGIASMIAASEMLRTGQFPAQLNYRQPNAALQQAEGVLTVAQHALRLNKNVTRIAIDGFGFGGANAHLVVEAPDSSSADELASEYRCDESPEDAELVVVGWHRFTPDSSPTKGSNGATVARFDRGKIELPQGAFMLPDLVDDMDITQRLALAVVDGALPKSLGGNDSWRARTSIVLALQGKTERAIEATLRVLAPRLSRQLAGQAAAERVVAAARQARPSGPYTLQCMMPNVAAGRAALQFNLNGPNFVVDAGANSLEAAFDSAAGLLSGGQRGGTEMAIVAAIQANRWPVPGSDAARASREYAVGFAVTKRSTANRLGLKVLSTVDDMLRRLPPLQKASCDSNRETSVDAPSTEQKLETIIQSLTGVACPEESTQSIPADDRMPEGQFVMHGPTWIEAPLGTDHHASRRDDARTSRNARWLIVAKADKSLLEDLLAVLPDFCRQYSIALVGSDARRLAEEFSRRDMVAWDGTDEESFASRLAEVQIFEPDLVVALERPTQWELPGALSCVADNTLCEAVFMVMKRLAPSLRDGKTEVWGAFPSGYRRLLRGGAHQRSKADDKNRGTVHPCSGAVVGLLRAAKREMPEGRFGVVHLRSDNLSESLRALQRERTAFDNDEQEIVCDGNRRLVQRLRNFSSLVPQPNDRPRLVLDKNSVVIATGGARGVTAVMVEALLRDVGCTVIALGRSPLEPGPDDPESETVEANFYTNYLADHPNALPVQMNQQFKKAKAAWEAHRTLTEFTKLPGQIGYMALDVTNPAEVDVAIAQIVKELGRVDLIMHGAGVQYSKRLEDRKLTEFRQTYDAKVSGLKHLVDACRKHTGKTVAVHALTSAYSIFGNDGQHDYGAANVTMDRLCQLSELHSESVWTSMAWSAWNGVGMTRGSEYQALAARRNLALLEPPEGQRLFRSVMDGSMDSRVYVPLSAAERTRYRVRTLPPYPSEKPMRTIEMSVPFESMGYLSQHKIRGSATMPGAWIIEQMVRGALALSNENTQSVVVEDIQFMRFVRVFSDPNQGMRIVVDATRNGYAAKWIGNIVSSSGVDLLSDVVFAQASIKTRAVQPTIDASLNGTLAKETLWRSVDDPYCKGNQNVSLSGAFDCLRQIEIAPTGVRRALFAPKIDSHWDDVIPALLLDASLRVACMHLVKDGLHVPTHIDRVIVPVGVSTRSLVNAGWEIRSCAPSLAGNQICSQVVEIVDAHGVLRGRIEGSRLTMTQLT